VREGWEVKELGTLCKLTRGHNPPKNKFINEPRDGYVRFYQIRDGWSDDYIVYVPDTPQLHKIVSDDFLMVAYRHIGKVFRGVNGAFNVALCKISNNRKDKLDNDFLFYMIPSDVIKGELMKRSERSLIPSMSVEHLKKIIIPLPPLPEQQRIVAILDKAFAAIAKAKANAEQNLKNAKELFESYLQGVFENKGKGWEEKILEEICEIKHGFAFSGKDFENDFYGNKPIVLTPGNFSEDATLIFNERNTKRCHGDYPKEYEFQIGELVVVMTDLSSKMKILGKPAIIKDKNILHNQRIGRFIFFDNSIYKYFLFFFLQTNYYLRKIKDSATGTMVRHTAPKRILKIKIPMPPLEKQQSIVQKLDALSAETKKLETIYQQKIKDLEELKKSVLQKALNGELTEKDIAL
jgi:type I restriction enzyme, S subunit